ncbi:hypothetical protein EVG20_g3776 [Dentipellis fragilis]|uniref:Ribosome biogenesis protein NSA2 homolog n=1 Tax=Dentipellis fragilis TaxID=205917 RepID=A0A4Y9Z1T8_9AGAM|nr:hypothetical protein EVG20_g3776 [Dentipellis fragilis]
MPQNEYIEEHIKRHGRRLDYFERKRKREARAVHKQSAVAQKAFGLKAKLLHAKRHAEKVQLRKTLKAHDERNIKQADSSTVPDDALPTYLLDREDQKDAKALSSAIKQKRKDKAAKYAVPLPKVRGIAEDEMFKVMRTGKSKSKSWKRMVTKATFVGEGFTRKPVKMERFVRPMALRYKKANVTHPGLKATFQLQILGVKKNPQSPMYTQLGVLTKGTVIEVNVSELGMVTTGGKVVFGKYAQVTNNPENDGCINAVLCQRHHGACTLEHMHMPSRGRSGGRQVHSWLTRSLDPRSTSTESDPDDHPCGSWYWGVLNSNVSSQSRLISTQRAGCVRHDDALPSGCRPSGLTPQKQFCSMHYLNSIVFVSRRVLFSCPAHRIDLGQQTSLFCSRLSPPLYMPTRHSRTLPCAAACVQLNGDAWSHAVAISPSFPCLPAARVLSHCRAPLVSRRRHRRLTIALACRPIVILARPRTPFRGFALAGAPLLSALSLEFMPPLPPSTLVPPFYAVASTLIRSPFPQPGPSPAVSRGVAAPLVHMPAPITSLSRTCALTISLSHALILTPSRACPRSRASASPRRRAPWLSCFCMPSSLYLVYYK